jgi:Mrp family chromosome partitioning ATPase
MGPQINSDKVPDACPGLDNDAAGKASACAGCPNQSICASGAAKEVDPAIAQIAARFHGIAKTVLVLSGKGGVGKSTVSAAFAFHASGRRDDAQVGVLDVDVTGPSLPLLLGCADDTIQATSSGWAPVHVDDNLCCMSIQFMLPSKDHAVIWRGPKKNGIIKQFLRDVDWGPLDLLIVDTPPGTSDEHLAVVTYLKEAGIDGAILVTTPQEVALQDVRKEIQFCRKVGVPILGVIENMSGFICPSCNEKSSIFKPTSGGALKMCNDLGTVSKLNLYFIAA